MSESRAWWVSSDPEHPVNKATRRFADTVAERASADPEFRAALAEEDVAPQLGSQTVDYDVICHGMAPQTEDMLDQAVVSTDGQQQVMDHPAFVGAPVPISDALRIAQSPGVTTEDREHAMQVLRDWEARHAAEEVKP